eukprot:454545_1
MGNKQSKKDKAKEQGGGCCGFFCGVLIIIALALDRISFPNGEDTAWCGFETIHSDDGSAPITYDDLCNICPDGFTEPCEDACSQMTAGYAWIVLNIIAIIACVGAAIAVVLKKGKKFAKFGYLIAAFALLIAIIWFCFGSPMCYAYDSDVVNPSPGYSMIIDILAMIFLFMAIYCVC